MLREWTSMAERMTAGEEASPTARSDSTLRTAIGHRRGIGAAASALTLTIGFGPSFFLKDGKDRFGIADKRPALADLPKFPNETMDPAQCGGDIVVQACANDPQVAVHAIRNLARVGFGTVAVRYSQLGFGRTSSTTPRTKHPSEICSGSKTEPTTSRPKTPTSDDQVWVGRRRRSVLDDRGLIWSPGESECASKTGTEQHFSSRNGYRSTKGSGRQRPQGRVRRTRPDLVTGENTPLIDVDAHVRLASHQHLNGIRILRRGYNFTDGTDGFGHLDAACSSSPSSATRLRNSSPCKPNWLATTRSTSTSRIPVPRCSDAHRGWVRATTGAPRYWADRYWADRYWADRYWAIPSTSATHSSLIGICDPSPSSPGGGDSALGRARRP